jgi:hypothetical protein
VREDEHVIALNKVFGVEIHLSIDGRADAVGMREEDGMRGKERLRKV